MAFFSHHDLNGFIATYGYWAIALIVAFESMGLPLPGETMLIIGAGYAGSHGGSLPLVILSAAAGAIVGDNIGYVVGRELGARFLHTYGSKIGLTAGRIKLGQYLFMRYGGKVVFIGRFIAVLRVLAAFLAGANRMAWPHFLVANAAGAIVWATAIGVAAYWLGRGMHRIQGPIGVTTVALAGVAAIWIIFYLRRHEAEMQAAAEKALPGPVT
jgi:membrane protein DedA with SNARE-associated domain